MSPRRAISPNFLLCFFKKRESFETPAFFFLLSPFSLLATIRSKQSFPWKLVFTLSFLGTRYLGTGCFFKNLAGGFF